MCVFENLIKKPDLKYLEQNYFHYVVKQKGLPVDYVLEKAFSS